MQKQKNKKAPFLKLIQKFTWVAVILFVVAFLFAGMISITQKPKTVTLNELAEKISAEEVTKMTLSGEDISATLKDGTEVSVKKEPGAGILESLSNYGIDPAKTRKVAFEIKDTSLKETLFGLILPTVLPLIAIVVVSIFLFRKFAAGANQAMLFGKANVHLFTNFKEKVTFKDVAGLKEAKQELIEVVDFLKNPKKYIDLGAKIPRGVLLMGPPGTGKTLLARSVAGEAGVPFFHISASEFVEMFVGVGAARTRDAFQTAKQAAPSILFIDEIDAVGRERGAGLGGGHDEREQTLNQILVEMDGFDRDANVIVLAATNRPDVLDPALLRPGRFDRRVFLDLPDIAEREEILAIHAKNKPLVPEVNLRRVAERTPGFSGADLANLLNEAAILTAQKDHKEIEQQDIYDSIEKVILGPARKSKIVSDRERKITAYHEAGHALVGAAVPDSDPVHKVSIVSRGRAGGYTMRLPIEDVRIKTKKQFLSDLAVALGGRAAEKMIFDDLSTGASEDLKQATEIARSLVTRYGMSEKMGPVTYGNTEEAIFLGREIMTEKNYSEKTAEAIDSEIKNFIEEAYEVALSSLKKYKEALEKIADSLMEKETLERDEFYGLVSEYGLKEKKD